MVMSRWIPKDSQMVEHSLGVVYTYEQNGRVCAVAYIGKSTKSAWHNSFLGKDPIAVRAQKIRDFFHGLEVSAKAKAERRAERTKPHDLKVGDIVLNSWGYDQTNVDFYVVVRASANYVWLQAIACDTTETGFMCGNTVPELPLRIVKRCGNGKPDEPEQHRAEIGGYVHFEHGSGHKWNGKPERCSWYA